MTILRRVNPNITEHDCGIPQSILDKVKGKVFAFRVYSPPDRRFLSMITDEVDVWGKNLDGTMRSNWSWYDHPSQLEKVGLVQV